VPYYVKKISGVYVVLDNKGKPYGKHRLRSDAEKQQAALYASEHKTEAPAQKAGKK